MTSRRLYFILIAVICLMLLGLVGGTYGTNKLLASQASKLTNLKAKSQALDQEQISLKQAQEDIRKYSGLHKIARSVVPEDKDQAEAVREIVNIAAANNVSLAAINFPASNLGNSSAASGSAGASAAPKPTPVNSKVNGLSQLQAVKNIPGVYELLITVEGDSSKPVQYSKFINFLDALEHNRRTAQVNTITIVPDPKNSGYLTFTLSLKEYIKP